jgi:hypothetical protein
MQDELASWAGSGELRIQQFGKPSHGRGGGDRDDG